MAEEKAVNTTFRELAEGVERPVGEVHELVVFRSPVKVFNLEGLFFFEDGAVLMPKVPDVAGAAVSPAVPPPMAAGPAGAADSGTVAPAPSPSQKLPAEQIGEGLLLLRNLLSNAQAASGTKGMVTAHTDLFTGAPALELTRRRAQNVFFYLKGDRQAFAASCVPCLDSEWQAILQWVAERFGYPCDPGRISTPLQAQARAALRRFRQAFNQDREGKLEERGEVSAQDFEAFFDLYDAWIARMLGKDDLEEPRGKLSFMDPGSLGVGSHFLDQGPRDALHHAPDNRRAELLLFESGHLPNPELVPPGRHIYEGREFTLQRLEVEPASCVLLELSLSEDIVDALPPDAKLTLSGPLGPEQERLLLHGRRDAGRMLYCFDWLDPSVSVTLKANAGAREVVIFQDQKRGDLGGDLDVGGTIEELLDDEIIGDDSQPLPLSAGQLPPFDELVEHSPAVERMFALRLHDQRGEPLGATFFRVRFGATPSTGQAAADGKIELTLPPICAEKIELEWGSDSPQGPFLFSRGFMPECGGSNDRARLYNLGYDAMADFAAAASAFQSDYHVDHEPAPKGLEGEALPAATRSRLEQLFSGDCDATPAS